MRIQHRFIIVTALSLAIAASANAQTQRSSSTDQGPTDQEVQQALARNKPGPYHKNLSPFVGSWSTVWKIWHQPDTEPSDISTGSATFKWMLGGRFLRGTYTGDNIMGMPFQGELTIGYDTERKEYFSLWLNSFETGLTSLAGEARIDSGNRNLVVLMLTGRPRPHPKTNENVSFRNIVTFVNSDQIVEQDFVTDSTGREFKAVEVIYTRVKNTRR